VVRCAPYGVEERNTLRTSGESEAETKRPPINKKSHLTQKLAPGANLACSGNRLASDASSFIYFFALNRTLAKLNLFIIIRDK
jgi:hypothetical protein